MSLATLNTNSQAVLNPICLAALYAVAMTIGARIRQIRIQHGMSGERFGELMGVTKGMVSQWESDSGIPPTDRLMMLKSHIEFSMDWLIFGITRPDQKYASLSNEALEFASEWEALEPDRRAAYKTLVDMDTQHQEHNGKG